MKNITDKEPFSLPHERLYEEATPDEVEMIFGGLVCMIKYSQSCTGQTPNLMVGLGESYVSSGTVSLMARSMSLRLTEVILDTELDAQAGEVLKFTRFSANFLYRHASEHEPASAVYGMQFKTLWNAGDSGQPIWRPGSSSEEAMPVQNNNMILLYNYVALHHGRPTYPLSDSERAVTLLTLGFPPPVS